MSDTTKSVDKELYQKITDICFENGGVTKPMVDRLYALFTKQLQEAEPKNEHEYKLWWIEKHEKADEIISSKDGNPIAVIYRYPPYAHIKEVDELFREIAEVERLAALTQDTKGGTDG